MTPEQKDEEVRCIKDITMWPRWPLLPVKRYVEGGELEVGFLCATAAPPPAIIYMANIFALPHATTWRELLDAIPERQEYSSIEEMVNDGWSGD